MKQYQSKHTAVLSTRGFYTILSLCALIIAASAWVIWGNAHRQNAVEPDTGMPIIAPADSTAEAPTEPATVPQQEQEPEPVLEEQPVTAAEPEPAVTVSAPVYVRPVSGAVLTPFSGDTLLFQPTMGDWRVHAGTDFSAEAGETVLALTDGTVMMYTTSNRNVGSGVNFLTFEEERVIEKYRIDGKIRWAGFKYGNISNF